MYHTIQLSTSIICSDNLSGSITCPGRLLIAINCPDDLKPNSITLAGSELVRSELVRSWFESDSVMEFGFEPAPNQLA